MKKQEHSFLDALFNIKRPVDQPSPFRLPDKKRAGMPAIPSKKRPWQSGKEECPVCGTLFPAGGSCPGCGLHDEDMRHS